jgi:hypothetical protein
MSVQVTSSASEASSDAGVRYYNELFAFHIIIGPIILSFDNFQTRLHYFFFFFFFFLNYGVILKSNACHFTHLWRRHDTNLIFLSNKYIYFLSFFII